MGSAVAIGVPAMARARLGPASDATHQKRVNRSDRHTETQVNSTPSANLAPTFAGALKRSP